MSGTDNPYVDLLGISPEDCPPNYYQLLGLPPFESDPDAVQEALAARMRLLKGIRTAANNEACRRLVAELTAARVCLLNPNRKSAYDKGLRHALGDQDVAPEEEKPKELPAAALLKVMSRQRMLSAEIVSEWTQRVEKSPTPMSAVELSKQLVDAGVVTFGIAKRLLAKTRELAESMEAEGKSIDDMPTASESAAPSVGRPTAAETTPKVTPPEEEPKKRADEEPAASDEEELGLAPIDDAAAGIRPKPSTAASAKTPDKQADSASPAKSTKPKTATPEKQKESKTATADRLAEELAADAGLGPLDELSADDMLDGMDAEDGGPLYRRRRRGLAGWLEDLIPRQRRPRTKEEALEQKNQSRLMALLFFGVLTIIVLVVLLAISMFSTSPIEYYYQGNEAFESGDDKKAIEAFKILFKEDPKNEMAEAAKVKLAVAELRMKVKQAESTDGLLGDFNATIIAIHENPYFSAIKTPMSELMLDTIEKMAEEGSSNKKLMEDAKNLMENFDQIFIDLSKSDRATEVRQKLGESVSAVPSTGTTTPPSSTVPPSTVPPSTTVPPASTEEGNDPPKDSDPTQDSEAAEYIPNPNGPITDDGEGIMPEILD